MDHQQLAHRVAEACRVRGQFVLRSGEVSDRYFDKYLFEADPDLLAAVADGASARIPDGTEVLAGLELGGVPVATALSLRTGLPAAFVRKQAKAYGTCKLAEGAEIDGRQLLIVEDVITTGGQAIESTAALRDRGAIVDTVLCIIDRSGGDHRELLAVGLTVVSLFTDQDLERAVA